MNYAILDIETTGGKYNEEGITEIAIYKFDGHEITDQFISLVNPEIPIQPFVINLTGINNDMLKTAPKFYEVAKRIVEITEDCIIVAHNAVFDYRILRTEFERLGFPFERQSLCTVELAQKLLPNQKSYSLGKLVRSLGIPLADRHRATGDALATVQLFKLLLSKDVTKTIVTQTIQTQTFKEIDQRLVQLLENIPSATGVYYLFDKRGTIIYLGKSRNLKRKITQHFTNTNRKSQNLQEHVANVSYDLTGSELIALLKENEEVSKNRPKFNTHAHKPKFNQALYSKEETEGYLELLIQKPSYLESEITTFTNRPQAQMLLSQWIKKYDLDPSKVTFQKINRNHKKSAFNTKKDHSQEEDVKVYNQKVIRLMEEQSLQDKTFMVFDKGRVPGEQSLVYVENGKLIGYTYFTLYHQIQNTEILKTILTPIAHTANTKHIFQNYLRKNKRLKIKKI
ncbi:exonuclease domain-containing protein [Aquimarina sp. ERC-38]|uniref:exonuclease domain-containing protein n=1 Tax=Aquimarina sp. ERC-38 TaxID=2949996 RepID=UPI0022457F15|nr:exonuclease domain-containing protein [Aquimarina sp. ERC-38]UZO79379.1 exonuclease domain-containing protein [Aquimarina sp. ERC-38]